MSSTKKPLNCFSCGLREGCDSPKMAPYGNGKKGILVIGEAPGVVEDRKGLPWQGRTGRLLQRTMHKLGVDLFEDCVCINAINCRPPNNRTPKPFEIDCCREVLVQKTIDSMKPHVIILLGSVAVQSFIGPRWPTDLGGIMKWRGFRIPDQDYGCWVVPTFHPSYVYRIESREANTIWEQDLSLAIEALEMGVPTNEEPEIKILTDLSIFNHAHENEYMSFDYETTGLKSQAPGHRIICASVAFHHTKVFAFMMPKTKSERRPFMDLLTDSRVGKMAHNMKFEDAWTLNRLGIQVDNWLWDSMLAAHILDNRTGVTGLKFQTYVNFGVIDYSSEITPYLRSASGGNGFNKIHELLEQPGGEEALLKYCALDSHYEYKLAMKQMEEMNYQNLPF